MADQHTVTLEDGTVVSIYALKKVITVEQMAQLMTDWMNSMSGHPADKFAEYICGQHRTLQQSVIGFFWHVLLAIPKHTFGTDLRNEDSVNLCKTLKAKVDSDELPEYLAYV